MNVANNLFELTHSKTMPDGRKVDILRLYELLKNRRIIELPIARIKPPSRSKRSGFSYTRLNRSDTSFPLIVDEDMLVIDGRHRFFKLLLDEGVKVVSVRVATLSDIDAATIKDESELIKSTGE